MIYILIPVFNEEKNITNLYNELKDTLPGEDKFFVFSDDGSTDNSVALLNSLYIDLPYVILGNGGNMGPGLAFNTGFEWILEHSGSDADIIVTMEADCTSDIKLLPKMVAINRLGFNLVLASVYAQGGGFDKTSWIRKFFSAIANILFRYLFNIKVLTLSSFYRVYSVTLLKKIKMNNNKIIAEKGFICMLEILVKACKVKASIIEVPMMLRSKKRIGKSKMNVLKTTWRYFQFLIMKS